MPRVAAALSLSLAATALLVAPRAAAADDTVRRCIAASSDGQIQRDRGALLGARERFLACARDECPAVVRSQCARWLVDLDSRIPTLVVRAQDASGADRPDATLLIDDAPAKLDGHPVPLDPGEHAVMVTVDGRTKREKLLVVEGERTRVLVVRVDTPPAAATPAGETAPGEPPSGHRVPVGAWITGGAGILAVAGGVAFALAARSDLSKLESSCSPHCTDAQTQTGRTHALLADTLLVAGGAAFAAGVVWAVAWPSAQRGAAIASLRLDVRPANGGAAAVLTARAW